jgi:nitroimidazol reductase NimA-like FMN-containing flavoprotein (pyridoxamine 5'-phosphate oxidase superfamily)
MPDDDSGLLPWEWAEDRLTSAANYWFATVWPDGRPHASPIWAVWLDGKLYFDGSPETRRMKNIAANPNVAVHLESGNEVVIIDGTAGAVPAPPDRALTERLSAAYTAKYKQHDYSPAPDQWDEGGLYVMQPKIGIGWTFREGEEFGKTYTRWRFDES